MRTDIYCFFIINSVSLYLAICAVCHPWEALLIGVIGAAVANWGTALEDKLGIDDPVGAFPTHALASVWGLIATGLFCESTPQFAKYSGLFKDGKWKFLGVQVLAIICIASWAAICTFLQLYIIDKIFGLRMSDEEEEAGADYYVHNICSEGTASIAKAEHENGRSEESQVVSSADASGEDLNTQENEVLAMEYSPADMENLQEINSSHPSGKRKIIYDNEISLRVVPYLERQIATPKLQRGRSNSGYHTS